MRSGYQKEGVRERPTNCYRTKFVEEQERVAIQRLQPYTCLQPQSILLVDNTLLYKIITRHDISGGMSTPKTSIKKIVKIHQTEQEATMRFPM